MKTVAIIAEYNPFHNGHMYQLSQSISATGADYSIALMSGNFLQRGDVALIDKYSRAHMCISSGIDLVLELPFPYATGSALDFSMGAVSILDSLNSIDYLCFGAETPILNIFYKIANVILEEPDSYKNSLKSYMSGGFSYPSARQKALTEYFRDDFIASFVSSPNNILGLEYICALKRLGSSIVPVPIMRKSAGYHDPVLYGKISSATAIRNFLYNANALDGIRQDVPRSTYDILSEKYKKSWPVYTDYLTPFLQAHLILNENYSEICDINEDISNKISKLTADITYSQALNRLTTKEYTKSRIKRCLIHLIMGYTREHRQSFIDNGYSFYSSILGFRRSSSSLLKYIKDNSLIPVITKKADFSKELEKYNSNAASSGQMWMLDTRATELYNCLIYNSLGYSNTNDFITPLPIL